MQFTETHEQLRDTVAKFVANDINPYVDEWEAADQFPSHEVFKKMGTALDDALDSGSGASA